MKQLLFGALIISSSFVKGQTDLFFTDFQSGIPAAYSIVDNDQLTPAAQVAEYTDAWITVSDPNNPLDSVAASTSFFEPTGTADRWLITPALNLGAYGNYIAWSARSQDASFPDSYRVMLSTTDNDILSFTDTLGSISEEYSDWTDRFVNLSTQGYANQTVYVAFVNITENGFKLFIDDIHAWKEDPVSVVENDEIILKIFPNPATEMINISSSQTLEMVEIYSMKGTLEMVATTNLVDVRMLPAGVYTLRVITAKSATTRRLIKF
jgi:hypothetical protein